MPCAAHKDAPLCARAPVDILPLLMFAPPLPHAMISFAYGYMMRARLLLAAVDTPLFIDVYC